MRGKRLESEGRENKEGERVSKKYILDPNKPQFRLVNKEEVAK